MDDRSTRELLQRIKRLTLRVSDLERIETVGDDLQAFSSGISLIQMFPGIVAIWPGSGFVRGSSQVLELLNGLNLDRNNSASISHGFNSRLPSYMTFDGVDDYFSHIDNTQLDIDGTEALIDSSLNGLTIGCWFAYNSTGSNEMIMGKSSALTGATGSYSILKGASDNFRFRVTDGSTENITPADNMSVTSGQWNFGVGRYDPDNEVKIWLNEVSDTNTTSIISSIQNTADNFTIGADSGGSNPFGGHVAMAFLAAAAVPDDMIELLYEYTRPLFTGN